MLELLALDKGEYHINGQDAVNPVVIPAKPVPRARRIEGFDIIIDGCVTESACVENQRN